MRHFYKQISVDAENMRFYAACPICGSRQYSKKLPLLCRSKAQLPLYETGAASGMRQRSFLSARASASMALAVKFNLCRRCGRGADGAYLEPERISLPRLLHGRVGRCAGL